MTFDDWLTTDVDGDRAEGQYRAERDAADGDREQRSTDFVAEVQRWVALYGWNNIFRDLAWAHNHADADVEVGPGRFAWHILQFQQAEGWPGVLSAISRAMREASAAALRETVKA